MSSLSNVHSVFCRWIWSKPLQINAKNHRRSVGVPTDFRPGFLRSGCFCWSRCEAFQNWRWGKIIQVLYHKTIRENIVGNSYSEINSSNVSSLFEASALYSTRAKCHIYALKMLNFWITFNVLVNIRVHLYLFQIWGAIAAHKPGTHAEYVTASESEVNYLHVVLLHIPLCFQSIIRLPAVPMCVHVITAIYLWYVCSSMRGI